MYPDIKSIGVYQAPVYDIDLAHNSGFVTFQEIEKSGYRSILLESERQPIDMSVMALKSAHHEMEHVSRLIYCNIHHQGGTFLWSSASYIASILDQETPVPCFNLMQGCNSLRIALEQSARNFKNDEQILLMASDRFDGTPFNRWSSDYGIIYGDAAISALLTAPGEGCFAIEGIKTVWANDLEAIHRYPFNYPVNDSDYFDIRKSKKSYLESSGGALLKRISCESVAEATEFVLREAKCQASDVQYTLLPHLGESILADNYLPALHSFSETINLELGLSTGHLGCSDGLHDICLMNQKEIFKPGSLILIVSAGAGFSWTATLLRKR